MAVVKNGKAAVKTTAVEAASGKTAPSWMKRGAAAVQSMQKQEQKDQEKYEALSKMFRFWLSPGETAQITFLDGKLTEDGVLDCLSIHEHNLFMSGKWGNFFTCVGETEPCPICEGGVDSRWAGFLTVIDHREYKGKKATYKNTLKLFAFTATTFKVLQQLATKRGGLAGCTFDVTRTSDDEARVGNIFDFTEKRTSKKAIADSFGMKIEDIHVADYEVEIPYLTADELREKGFGSPKIGGEKSHPEQGGSTTPSGQDYAEDL